MKKQKSIARRRYSAGSNRRPKVLRRLSKPLESKSLISCTSRKTPRRAILKLYRVFTSRTLPDKRIRSLSEDLKLVVLTAYGEKRQQMELLIFKPSMSWRACRTSFDFCYRCLRRLLCDWEHGRSLWETWKLKSF